MIPEFSDISVDRPFMSAGFKAESARDFYDCAATGWHRRPTLPRRVFDRWPFSLE